MAAKCPERGTLASEEGPLSPEDISLKTGADEKTVARALDVLTNQVGWLEISGGEPGEETGVPGESPDAPADSGRSPAPHNRTEYNNTKESACADSCSEVAEPPPADPVFLEFECTGPKSSKKTFHLSESKVEEYASSFPAVDVRAELRAAWQWHRDNPRKRKTHAGMPRFLSSWLTRVQNSGGSRGSPQNGNANGETSGPSIAENLRKRGHK